MCAWVGGWVGVVLRDSPLNTTQQNPFLVAQVRTCSFSVHSRALRIVQLLDPSNTTLLKNWSEATKMVFAREDILASALGGNSQSGAFATPGGPVKKSLRCCQLPVKAEQCTLILDDIPQVWPAGVQDNIIPILGPDKVSPSNTSSPHWANQPLSKSQPQWLKWACYFSALLNTHLHSLCPLRFSSTVPSFPSPRKPSNPPKRCTALHSSPQVPRTLLTTTTHRSISPYTRPFAGTARPT